MTDPPNLPESVRRRAQRILNREAARLLAEALDHDAADDDSTAGTGNQPQQTRPAAQPTLTTTPQN
jgi:hypothetical protein